MNETPTTQENTITNPEPKLQLEKTLSTIQEQLPRLQGLHDTVKGLGDKQSSIETQVAELRMFAKRTHVPVQPRPGKVSDDCARHLAAQFIVHCERSNKLEALSSMPSQRGALLDLARSTLDISTRSALTTSDIPLPTEYSGELRELISQFGVVRRQMSPYPIGLGTARPARMGTRPAFASIAMSGAIPEKSPTITFASLESHKIGGIVRLPREIDEQSIVP